ncbi:MAG: glucose-6-phosphate dehydrogenase [bacterium]|nr:glucose-6-phosphate dehydrogenase [bacterium]
MPLNATPLTPITLIIFGATGNLATTRLFPAIFHLYKDQYTPKDFRILGIARRELTNDAFRMLVRDVIKQYFGSSLKEQEWSSFASLIEYQQLDFSKRRDYDNLCTLIGRDDVKKPRSKLYYLAVAPEYYAAIFDHIEHCELPMRKKGVWTRVVIEKPFGTDFESAMQLNNRLQKIFHEDEIYRIDHYLGKETVQNILAFRFANGMFEPLWNHEFIDHVQMTVAEDDGVGARGAFYDKTGALRDVGQNHLLQLLAHIAMEKPKTLQPDDLRTARLDVLRKLKGGGPHVDDWVVSGQYDGYTREENIHPSSKTETFVSLKLFVDTPRWNDIPFYVRTGKKLARDVTEVSIQFRKPVQKFFGHADNDETNILTLRIQPDEGIALRLNVKRAGHGRDLQQVEMNYCYKHPSADGHEAYDTLLLDAMHGDQSLFPHLDEVMASWKFVTPMLGSRKTKRTVVLYPQGSWGPKEADELLVRDGRAWLTGALQVCDIHH